MLLSVVATTDGAASAAAALASLVAAAAASVAPTAAASLAAVTAGSAAAAPLAAATAASAAAASAAAAVGAVSLLAAAAAEPAAVVPASAVPASAATTASAAAAPASAAAAVGAVVSSMVSSDGCSGYQINKMNARLAQKASGVDRVKIAVRPHCTVSYFITTAPVALVLYGCSLPAAQLRVHRCAGNYSALSLSVSAAALSSMASAQRCAHKSGKPRADAVPTGATCHPEVAAHSTHVAGATGAGANGGDATEEGWWRCTAHGGAGHSNEQRVRWRCVNGKGELICWVGGRRRRTHGATGGRPSSTWRVSCP
mgnify:CR=1 FL=1